jgi:hypothetical protein
MCFTVQVIAFASHPAALVMAAAEGGAPNLKPLSSFNSRANQQDLLAALNARIAKETAELADLKAKVARERERQVLGCIAAFLPAGCRQHHRRLLAVVCVTAHVPVKCIWSLCAG